MAKKSAIRYAMEEQRSLAFGSISGTYAGVGTALTNPARQIFVDNATDADLQFSLDGVTDHFVVLSRSSLVSDIAANKTQDAGFYMAEGDRLYVKTIEAPTEKSVYFSVIYGEDQ
jgi:hypothetical protein